MLTNVPLGFDDVHTQITFYDRLLARLTAVVNDETQPNLDRVLAFADVAEILDRLVQIRDRLTAE